MIWIPRFLLHKRSELKPTWRGKRSATNYPFIGIWYTNATTAGVLEQEKYEYWTWTGVISVGVLFALLWWPSIILWAVYWLNPWHLAYLEVESHALTIEEDFPNQGGLRDLAVLSQSHGMAAHRGYWFFRVIGWDAARIEKELRKAL